MRRLSSLVLACAVIASGWGAERAWGTQYLVRGGDNWEQLAPKLRPGDEVILMPGQHRPATFTNLRGEPDKPIIFRGINPETPGTIDATLYGIRLHGTQHIILRDLAINGAKLHAIEIAPPPEVGNGATNTSGAVPPEVGIDASNATTGEPIANNQSQNVRLERITITDTGPELHRHAIIITGLTRGTIENCKVTGWGGSAVEIIASRAITITGCTFAGKEAFAQLSGVRVRAGSSAIRIERCRFDDPGDQSVCIGGGSDFSDFVPALTEGVMAGSLFEATDITVEQCVMNGGRCGFALVNCDRAAVRRCTIVQPKLALVSLRREQKDPRFGDVHNAVIANCLFTWQPGDIQVITHLSDLAEPKGVALEENLWWSPNLSDQRAVLGPLPGVEGFPQVIDVDPKLNEKMIPTAPAAASFGATGPDSS